MTNHSAAGPPAASTSGRTVTLSRWGHSLVLESPCPDVLASLHGLFHAAVLHREGYAVRALSIPLWLEDSDWGRPVLVCGAGLEPVVRALLCQAGITILRTSPPPPATLPAPHLEAVQKQGAVDLQWLETVRRHDRALVRMEPQVVDPAWLVAQVAQDWPQVKIAFVVSLRAEAGPMARKLRRHGIRATVLTGQTNPAQVERVVVATYQGLGHTARAYDLNRLQIIVVRDALEALGRRASECLRYAWRARLYGLIDRAVTPAPSEGDELRGLFGLHEVVVPQHGLAERPARVVWHVIQAGPELRTTGPGARSLLERKRRGLWRQPLRNRRLARLAQALTAEDGAVRATLPPALATALADVATPSVLVLVENVEHGLILARQLAWPLLADPDVWRSGLSQADQAVLQSGERYGQPRPRCAVVTAVVFAALSWTDVDVVVRADGGVGLPPGASGDLVCWSSPPVRPLLLVDCFDRHDPLWRRWSRQRQQAYRAHGWLAPKEDPLQARLQAFRDARPPGGQR
jgi:hypothetical protein